MGQLLLIMCMCVQPRTRVVSACLLPCSPQGTRRSTRWHSSSTTNTVRCARSHRAPSPITPRGRHVRLPQENPLAKAMLVVYWMFRTLDQSSNIADTEGKSAATMGSTQSNTNRYTAMCSGACRAPYVMWTHLKINVLLSRKTYIGAHNVRPECDFVPRMLSVLHISPTPNPPLRDAACFHRQARRMAQLPHRQFHPGVPPHRACTFDMCAGHALSNCALVS